MLDDANHHASLNFIRRWVESRINDPSTPAWYYGKYCQIERHIDDILAGLEIARTGVHPQPDDPGVQQGTESDTLRPPLRLVPRGLYDD